MGTIFSVVPPSSEKEQEGLAELTTVPKESEVAWEGGGSLQ